MRCLFGQGRICHDRASKLEDVCPSQVLNKRNNRVRGHIITSHHIMVRSPTSPGLAMHPLTILSYFLSRLISSHPIPSPRSISSISPALYLSCLPYLLPKPHLSLIHYPSPVTTTIKFFGEILGGIRRKG